MAGKSKRPGDIPIEIPEAVENGALATKISKTHRGGLCRANDCGGCGGLEQVVNQE